LHFFFGWDTHSLLLGNIVLIFLWKIPTKGWGLFEEITEFYIYYMKTYRLYTGDGGHSFVEEKNLDDQWLPDV
jgi:hypothetical protein